MDSQGRAFEQALDGELHVAGTPLRCPRAMPVQNLTPWTPASVAGDLITALLAVPRALVLAPAVLRRRA